MILAYNSETHEFVYVWKLPTSPQFGQLLWSGYYLHWRSLTSSETESEWHSWPHQAFSLILASLPSETLCLSYNSSFRIGWQAETIWHDDLYLAFAHYTWGLTKQSTAPDFPSGNLYMWSFPEPWSCVSHAERHQTRAWHKDHSFLTEQKKLDTVQMDQWVHEKSIHQWGERKKRSSHYK